MSAHKMLTFPFVNKDNKDIESLLPFEMYIINIENNWYFDDIKTPENNNSPISQSINEQKSQISPNSILPTYFGQNEENMIKSLTGSLKNTVTKSIQSINSLFKLYLENE